MADRDDVPNYYDGPITMWAIVDKDGRPYAFDNERRVAEVLESWEKRLSHFGPYRVIKLVEQREN